MEEAGFSLTPAGSSLGILAWKIPLSVTGGWEGMTREGEQCLQKTEQKSSQISICPNMCFSFLLFQPQMPSKDMFF